MEKKNRLFLMLAILITGIILLVGCSNATTTTSSSAMPSTTATQTSASPQPSSSSPAATVQPSTSPQTSPSPTATTPPIELRLNLKSPPSLTAIVLPHQYFAEEVEKRTNGRVKVTLYLAGALAKPAESYDAVIKGVADISDGSPKDTAGRFPASAIADLPYNVPSTWVAAHALNDWYNHFLPKEFNDVHMLYLTTNPPALLGTAKKAVRTVDGIAGLSIRTSGAVETDELKALGAVPRSISSGDIYEALSKGNIDGCLISPESYPAFKLDEVINYVTDISEFASVSISYLVMNKDTWNKLSPGDQQIVQQVAQETFEMRAQIQDQNLVTNLAAFKAAPGKEFIPLSSGEILNWQAKIQPVVDAFVVKMQASGLPATDYEDYIAQRIKYWSKQTPPAIPSFTPTP